MKEFVVVWRLHTNAFSVCVVCCFRKQTLNLISKVEQGNYLGPFSKLKSQMSHPFCSVTSSVTHSPRKVPSGFSLRKKRKKKELFTHLSFSVMSFYYSSPHSTALEPKPLCISHLSIASNSVWRTSSIGSFLLVQLFHLSVLLCLPVVGLHRRKRNNFSARQPHQWMKLKLSATLNV